MPRATPILTNFTAGEWSPRLDGRVDLAKYYNACKTLENLIILPHGGAMRRPGTYYVADAKNADKRCRLVPFEFSVTQAYILEFGDLYIRIFKDNGQVIDVDANTSLLLHCDGDDASVAFTDDGYTGHTVTSHGNVQVDDAYKKFGSGAALFDGTGDYLTIADHADWNFGAGIFSVDFWFRMDTPATANFTLPFIEQFVDANNRWSFRYYYQEGAGAASQFVFYQKQASVEEIALTWNWGAAVTDKPTVGQWYHVALIRGWGGVANSWAVTVDGALIGTAQTETDDVPDFAIDPAIGYFQHTGLYYKGWLDEFRVSKGAARWTAAFTPPDRAYPSGLAGGGGGSVVEITTPYLESQLRQLQFAQSADTLYITHPYHAPRKVTRTSHTAWTLTEIDFQDGPYDEEVTAALSTTAASGQATIALKANGTHYLLYDDEDVKFVVGELLTGTTSTATAKIMVETDWGTEGVLCIAAISGTFQNNEDITDSGTGDATVNGTIGDGYLAYSTEAVAEPAVAEVFTGGTSGATGTVRGLQDDGDTGKMVLEMGANSVNFVVGETATGGTSGTTVVVTAFTKAHGTLFTSDDVGAPFRYYFDTTWTWLEIKSVTDDITAVCIVRGADITGSADASKYRKGTWKVDDYPGCVTFHEQRLVFAANNNKPQTIWGSEGGDYENFTPGVGDSNPFTYTIASDQVNAIRWLSAGKVLVAGTLGAEFLIKGSGSDDAITPTNIVIKRETTHGSANIKPLRIGHAVLFLQRVGRKLREFVWNEDVYNYVAPDMSILAEHITEGGIKEIVYQQELDSVIWAVRSDGVLLGMTYYRPEDVVGWHRHLTGTTGAPGYFESVAVIPYEGQDQVWVAVRREINGSTVRYIEYFTAGEWDDVTDGVYLDSALTYDGAAVTSLSGLDHLDGEVVSVLTDKGVHPDCTVSSNAITLNWSSTKVHVGLASRWKLQPMRLEAGQAEGTAQAKTKRIHKVTVRFYQTLACDVGPNFTDVDTIPFREAGDPMDALPPLFTGDKDIIFRGGYEKEGYICFTGNQPLPVTILGIIPHMATADD